MARLNIELKYKKKYKDIVVIVSENSRFIVQKNDSRIVHSLGYRSFGYDGENVFTAIDKCKLEELLRLLNQRMIDYLVICDSVVVNFGSVKYLV